MSSKVQKDKKTNRAIKKCGIEFAAKPACRRQGYFQTNTASMSRYAYGGVLMLIAVLAALFIYRTNQAMPTAEFGGVSLNIEYATTPETRERGLGGRTEIPENYGMLFVFPKEGLYGFWMKDMLVPIDIFWLDTQGQVVSIASDVATSSYPNVFYPTEPARYVLETAAGFARTHSVATGTPLSIQAQFLLKNLPTVSE